MRNFTLETQTQSDSQQFVHHYNSIVLWAAEKSFLSIQISSPIELNLRIGPHHYLSSLADLQIKSLS